ncbi:MAG: PQQ-dependent sugar dehydrogenase [Gaiellaceae bacterium MAG52_C11]|nr:PQQ-dependent sugar dehydrogenase [Candidatus Gaiellasilicea maunaloa]
MDTTGYELSGKIVRMTVDGAPHPDNPFFDAPQAAPRRYVWAYGLRNPFGLTFVGDELYATQNGISIDSFLRIERGRNYGWDGSDESIATNAEAVMIPATAPVHLAYAPEGTDLFPPEYQGSFFLGPPRAPASGEPGCSGSGTTSRPIASSPRPRASSAFGGPRGVRSAASRSGRTGSTSQRSFPIRRRKRLPCTA